MLGPKTVKLVIRGRPRVAVAVIMWRSVVIRAVRVLAEDTMAVMMEEKTSGVAKENEKGGRRSGEMMTVLRWIS